MIAVMAPTRSCPDCGSDVTEVQTFGGRLILIDRYPFPTGNVLLIERGGEIRAYVATAEAIDVMALARPRYRTHRCASPD